MLRTLIVVGVCALVLNACSNKTETDQNQNAGPAATMAGGTMAGGTMAGGTMASQSMTIVMHAQNGSGESGTATLTPMGPKTRIVIGLKGENTTGKQPAHVHAGSCAHLNPAPKYPLKDVVLGKSNTVVDASMDDLMSSPMAINVHESAANLKKYVSCGDLTK